MSFHLVAGVLAVFGSFIGTALYIRDTRRGETKPHMFTWLIWAVLMAIGSAVAFAGGASVSAGVFALGCLMNFAIFVLALRQGERNITRADWAAFLSALAIIPIWLATKEPLAAAILVTLIDALGYFPTFRKAWSAPQEENLQGFVLYTASSLASLLAVTPFTLVTSLYPSMILFFNVLLSVTILLRRQKLREPARGAIF